MEDLVNIGDHASGGLTARPDLEDELDVHGVFRFECVGEDGTVKWVEEISNLVTNEGKNHALDVTLSAGTQITAWYVGLINGTTATLDAADTMGSHAGWTEDQNYDEAARPAWSDGGVSTQSVSNSASPATFTMNATTDIYGAFMPSDSAKGGTLGKLFAEGAFSAARSVASGDTLNVTYTVNA